MRMTTPEVRSSATWALFALALLALLLPAHGRVAEGAIPISGQTSITSPGYYFLAKSFAVTATYAIQIAADHVTLDLNGQTLTNGNSTDGAVISVDASTYHKDIRITNGTLMGGYYGFYALCPGADVQVDHLRVINSAYRGISVNGMSSPPGPVHAVILDNVVLGAGPSGTGEGIYLHYANACAISGNLVADGGDDGIYLSYCDNNVITHNTVSYNHMDGIGLSYCYKNTVSHNTSCGSLSGDGIFIYESPSNTIDWNETADNGGYGIDIYSNGATVTGNIYSYNHCRGNSLSPWHVQPLTAGTSGGGNF